ncbi:MAG: hypothetical protein V2J24_21495 [Pseudomonadales bacterium]|jgi:hypothetical protein|nr:hypothetical protein [Pseudomonadales bacterium]
MGTLQAYIAGLTTLLRLGGPAADRAPFDPDAARWIDLTHSLVALPLKIAGGSGGPLRAVALVPD